MSPNEFQLRSALRDGEGEHVNPDTVIARARGMQQARHDRRVRYGSVAAAVAIVGGIGVVGGVVLGGGGAKQSAAGSGGVATNDRGANNQAGGGKSVPGAPAIAPGPLRDAVAIRCPETPPRLMLPGGGGTTQFGAQGPLFAGPVSAVKICVYNGGRTSVVPSTVLTGENATDLTKSIEGANKTLRAGILCPGGPAATDPASLVIIGLGKDGKQFKPVIVTLNCPTRVTNGTALRYNWTPSANIKKLINERISTNPGGGPISLPPPGKVTGSPIQS